MCLANKAVADESKDPLRQCAETKSFHTWSRTLSSRRSTTHKTVLDTHMNVWTSANPLSGQHSSGSALWSASLAS
eukprot:4030477-Amphidinium_carterae.1